MTNIEAHDLAVEKIYCFLKQHSSFKDLVFIKKENPYEEIPQHFHYAETKARSAERRHWIELRNKRATEILYKESPDFPNYRQLNDKYSEEYDTLTQEQRDNYTKLIAVKNFLKFGDLKYTDDENSDVNIRVVAGTSLTKKVLKASKNKLTIFADLENIEESKVCRTQTLVRYADTIKTDKNWISFKNIKNFCLLKDLPMFYVQLALIGGTRAFELENAAQSVSNVLSNPGFVGISSSGWSNKHVSSGSIRVDLINAFFTKVLPIDRPLTDLTGSVL